MTTGVLLVGLGQIGMGYDLELDAKHFVLSHARAFALHPSFELLGGVDSDHRQLELFSRVYRRPSFSSVNTALAELTPEVVVIGVPTNAHLSVLKDILDNHQPKAILCEKPLSYDIREAQVMLDLCAVRGVLLYVNYIRRSEPAVIEIQKLINQGQIKQPLKASAWYSKGLMHNGSHLINLMEYWLGPIQDFKILDAGRRWQGLDPEPDLYLKFRNSTATMQAAWEESYSHYALELVSPAGLLRYNSGGNHIVWHGIIIDHATPSSRFINPQPVTIHSDMHRYQYNVTEQLARAISGKKADICSGAEALSTLCSIHHIVSQL